MRVKNSFSIGMLLWISSLSLSAQVLVSVNKTISNDTLVMTVQKNSLTSKTLYASGEAVFSSKSGYIRILLSDDYGYDLLIYESSPLLAVNGIDNFSNVTMEAIDIPSHLLLTKIRVEIKNAVLNNLSITMANVGFSKTQQQARTDRVTLINSNLRSQNALWVAGETSVSQMSYEEKKGLFGGQVPDLQGVEYYIGGIFELNNDSDTSNTQTITRSSLYPPSFDWRNRHGRNWLTSVKHQGCCGSCWIFSPIGAIESMVNLYYNQKIDLDLSELQIVSCVGGTPWFCGGGYPQWALDYIIANGVVDEVCFPYNYYDPNYMFFIPCSNTCNNPTENIKIAGKIECIPWDAEPLKEMLIKYGPLSSGIPSWGHSMTLAGYGTINVGDTIYTGPYGSIVIQNNDLRVGETYWIFKNSYGTNWGNNGWGYIRVNVYDFHYTHAILPPITSLHYSNDSIICEDRDGDGYYYWGIGPKPATCPCEAPDEPDCDDSDPTVGPMNKYGYCIPIKFSCTASYSCSSSSIKVEWENWHNAASYVLEYSLNPDFSTIIGADTFSYNTTSYFFTERAAGTTYYFHVKAYNLAGDYVGYGKTSFTYPDIFPNASGVLFVKKGGSGDKGGYDWGNAHGEFSTALVAARANSCIKQIWVSDGTYYPTTTNDRNLSFNLPQNVKIYGGFPSSGNPIWANRDWVNNPTILSGNIRDTTIITDNSYTVVTASRNTYLDGFFVTGGYGASGIQASGNAELRNLRVYQNRATQAGGIAITKGIGIGDPTLTNCIIHSNAADFEGGGIGIFSGSPYLDHITIFGNVAATGGGLAVISGTPYFDSITLFGNLAQMSGGGIAVLSGTPRFYRMDIHHNHAHQGGGLAALGGCAKIERASIYNNHAFYQGGGIYVDSRGIRGGTTIEGENENYSERDTNFIAEEDGTIIRAPAIPDTRLYAKYIDIFGNYADGHGGGGIACLNDLYPYYPIMPIFENVAIHENQTPNNGGGVFNDNSEILFLNSLFYDNIGGNGAEIAGFANSSIILVHATITKTNIPPMNPEIVTMGQLELYNSIVCLNGFSPPPLGNNYIVPGNCSAIFVDDTNGNYTLTTPLSTAPFDLSQFLNRIYPHGLLPPCGLPSGLLQTDLAGYPRITNGRSNYGVYEYGSSPHWKSMNYNEEQKEEQQKPISKEVSGGNLQIYPNPTTGELRIISDGLLIEKVEIFDILGKLYKSETGKSETEVIIDISHLASGMYFITITNENKYKVTKKVVKE